jgi:DNA-binding NarL/FixJ family response regulator
LIPETPLSCALLADRHHGLTEGVRGLLETSFGTVVMVADEASLLDAAIRLQPEVAVVDLSLSRSGSLGWLQALRTRCPELKVVVLSVHDEQSVRRAVIEAGADAFVLKRAIASDLLNAVDAVRRSRSVEVSSDNRSPAREPGIHTGFQDAMRDTKSSSVEWKP